MYHCSFHRRKIDLVMLTVARNIRQVLLSSWPKGDSPEYNVVQIIVDFENMNIIQ